MITRQVALTRTYDYPIKLLHVDGHKVALRTDMCDPHNYTKERVMCDPGFKGR